MSVQVRLVLVCFYESYPPMSGAASVTWNAAKHAQGQKILIQMAKQGHRLRVSDGVEIITTDGATDNKVRKIAGLTKRIKRISQIVEDISPAVVVLEGASWVVFHMLLLREIRRRLPRTVIVYHAHNVEYVLRRQKHSFVISALTRWAEGKVVREADLLFAVSEVDRRQLETLYKIRPILLPNGVDLQNFDGVGEDVVESMRRKYGLSNSTILFMGDYAYRPNQEAIDFLMRAVMPKVLRQRREARLAVTGGSVPFKAPWLINPGNIPYDQLPAFIHACGIGVAPIFSGSGTRLKVLECMAGAKPVVASLKAVEGLDLCRGRNVLIAEEAGEFSTEICKLLMDSQSAVAIGESGRRFVEDRYAWNSIMHDFHNDLYAYLAGQVFERK